MKEQQVRSFLEQREQGWIDKLHMPKARKRLAVLRLFDILQNFK